MGSWLHSADPSGPHPNQLDPGWHVSERYNDMSHVLVDPHLIHRPTRLAILKVKGKTDFRVLKNLFQ